MNPIAELVRAIETLRAASGGTDDQRVASADLFVALFHVALVVTADHLQRAQIDARVTEGTSTVTLRFNGCYIEIQRFSGQADVSLKFHGFSEKVVPHADREQTFTANWTSIEAARQIVDDNARRIAELLRQEAAVRYAPKP